MRQALLLPLLTAVLIGPWLRHNWITSLGGTNRAVFESAAREGDPGVLSLASWLWYPRLLPEQLGRCLLVVGLSGCCFGAGSASSPQPITPGPGAGSHQSGGGLGAHHPEPQQRRPLHRSPAPLCLLLLLARGWWQWGHWLEARRSRLVWPLFGAGLLACVPAGWAHQLHRFEDRPRGPVEALVQAAGGADPSTLLPP